MAIKLTTKGDFKKTTKFLDFISRGKYLDNVFDKYGQIGVDALSAATPVRTGLTAASWYYEVKRNDEDGSAAIVWKNSNIVKGYPIAILIQYGHGTRNGGFVQGFDYINPAMQPVFEEIAEKVWKEVTSK